MNAEVVLPRATVALGENIKIGIGPENIRKSPKHLSIYSKEVAAAAAIRYFEKKADVIIFSEGHTAGEDYPSGAEAMATYAQDFYKKYCNQSGIPEEHIILEEKSKDTSTQAENLKEIARDRFELESVIAASFHTRRTKGIFDAFNSGVNHFLKAEDYLGQISRRHSRLMKKQTSVYNYKLWAERFKEFGLNSARYILLDPGQKRLRFLTHKSRS